MKKNNIDLISSTKKFNTISQKVISIKDKIEREIGKIDKLYDEVNSEIKNSFEIKHEKLIKEENDLREKLQNEVTKVKEQLEKFLAESNKIIRINEKINKGIKILEKEEKNNIKILSYVSKINKINKESEKLSKELIKNLKISFQKEQNNIKYEEYYFNGIPIPKDIQFKDISSNSFKVFWKIDELNLININNKQIKYKVLIKKENINEKFIEVYEGSNNNCLIENLSGNTNYELKICCIYQDLSGFWADIQKIKTNDNDSIILNESDRKNEFLKKIYEWSGYSNMKLLYRGTRDGSKSDIFHNKCDNQGPTICLYKNNKGNIFGGFTSISWTNSGGFHSDSNSFLFSLTNIYGISPTKFPIKDAAYSVYHNSSRGPSFGSGSEIYIYEDFLNQQSYSSFPCAYNDSLNKGKSIFTGDMNNNNSKFKIKEIEVFKLFK